MHHDNTPEQAAIIAHPHCENELVLVEAVAGSGKTHTIVQRALKMSTPTARSLMLAFNAAAQKHIARKLDTHGANCSIDAKTTTVYAREWDNDVRMDRSGYASARATLSVITATVRRLYDERTYIRTLKLLQICRNGDGKGVQGGAPARLASIVKTLSSLKRVVTPTSAGWSVLELRKHWLYLRRASSSSSSGKVWTVEGLREAWTTYVLTVLEPLFPHLPSDAFDSDFITDVTNAADDSDRPRLLSLSLLEDMCFIHWLDRQHEVVSQFNNVSMCAWSVMWFQWFSVDARCVLETARPAEGQSFNDAFRKFVARWSTVYVDEAQDLNVADLSAMAYHYAYGAQVVLVGDRLQSLYGFRMCVNAFSEDVRHRVLSIVPAVITTFKLSVSFRVPAASIRYLTDVLPTEMRGVGMTTTQAHAGGLTGVDFERVAQHVVGDTLVLGHKNISVAYLAVAYLQRNPGRPVYCADTLYRRIKPSGLTTTTMRPFTPKKGGSDADDVEFDEEDSAAYIAYKIRLTFGNDVLDGLRHAVKASLKPNEPYFSTVHSVKGMEARTAVLASDVVVGAGAGACVLYVAVTRAKQHVYIVNAIEEDASGPGVGSGKKRRCVL